MKTPQAATLEAAILGSIMGSPDLLDQAKSITPELFFSPAHAEVFSTIVRIREAGGACDLISVTAALTASGRIEQVGGAGALTQMLADGFGGLSAVEYHLATLRDCHARREMIATARAMQTAAENADADADSVLAESGERILSLALGPASSSLKTTTSVVPDMLEELEELMAGGGAAGLTSGLTGLDSLVGGYKNGSLVIVAARPAMGKSAMLVNTAEFLSSRDIPILFISLEMPAKEIASRVVLSRASVDVKDLRHGFASPQEKRRLNDCANDFMAETFIIDDSGGLSIADVRARARLAVRKYGVRAVFIDYLQLVTNARAKSRENEVGAVSRGLKAMALELNVPVIAAAQVNRQSENRDDNRPRLSDLRESGSIEQDADLVALIHRPDYYASAGKIEPSEQVAEVIVAKNRGGETGSTELRWTPRFTRFSDKEIEPPADIHQINGVLNEV